VIVARRQDAMARRASGAQAQAQKTALALHRPPTGFNAGGLSVRALGKATEGVAARAGWANGWAVY
jgi:hypothetical protein